MPWYIDAMLACVVLGAFWSIWTGSGEHRWNRHVLVRASRHWRIDRHQRRPCPADWAVSGRASADPL